MQMLCVLPVACIIGDASAAQPLLTYAEHMTVPDLTLVVLLLYVYTLSTCVCVCWQGSRAGRC